MTAPKLGSRTFACVLNVQPRPWKRPRFRQGQGFTDKDQVAAVAEIRWLVQMQKPERFEGPLYLRATFFLPRPKSAPKKKVHPTTRPDADNYGKLLMDALNGTCYVDDSQIVKLEITKAYGDPARVEFELGEL